jgi:hypothetical protein
MRDETRQVEDETVKWAMSDVAPMSDEAFERGRAALLTRIDAEESGEVVPLRRRRRRIPLVAAAAAMVVIAGVALVAPSLVAREKGRAAPPRPSCSTGRPESSGTPTCSRASTCTCGRTDAGRPGTTTTSGCS